MSAPLPLVTHDPKQMLYDLFSDPRNGIAATADDGVTMLKPSDITFKLDPYPLEPKGPYPLIVIGPETPLSWVPCGGDFLAEVHKRVEVRVHARPQTIPINLDGETIRGKLLDSIRTFVRAHHSDPDGTHTYDSLLVKDPGRNEDEPQGPPLFKTVMQIEVCWFE